LMPIPKDIIPSWAKSDRYDTAVFKTRSIVDIPKADANGEAIPNEFWLRAGDVVEMPVLITKSALKAGKGVPTRAEIAYMNLMSYGMTLRQIMAWLIDPKREARDDELVTSPYRGNDPAIKVIQGAQSWHGDFEGNLMGKPSIIVRGHSPAEGLRDVKELLSGRAKAGVQITILDAQGRIVGGESLVEPNGWGSTIGGEAWAGYGGKFVDTALESGISEAGMPANYPKDSIYLVDVFRGMRKNHSLLGSRNYVTIVKDPNWHPDPLRGSKEFIDPKEYPPEMRSTWAWDYVKNETQYWVARADRSGVDTFTVKGPPKGVYPEFKDVTVANVIKLKQIEPNAPVDIAKLKNEVASLKEVNTVKGSTKIGENIDNLKKNRDKDYVKRVEEGLTIDENRMAIIGRQRVALERTLADTSIPLELAVEMMRLYDALIDRQLSNKKTFNNAGVTTASMFSHVIGTKFAKAFSSASSKASGGKGKVSSVGKDIIYEEAIRGIKDKVRDWSLEEASVEARERTELQRLYEDYTFEGEPSARDVAEAKAYDKSVLGRKAMEKSLERTREEGVGYRKYADTTYKMLGIEGYPETISPEKPYAVPTEREKVTEQPLERYMGVTTPEKPIYTLPYEEPRGGYEPPYTPPYTPPYVPPYVPPYIPPYTPPYTPPYAPPYTPPYVPSGGTGAGYGTGIGTGGMPKPKTGIEIEKGKPILGENQGTLAWRQGAFYVTWEPPWDDTSRKWTKHPVEGIQYHEGYRSAYDSIQRRGGWIPPDLGFDMGAILVEVHTHGSQLQPELNFAQDPKDTYKGEKAKPRPEDYKFDTKKHRMVLKRPPVKKASIARRAYRAAKKNNTSSGIIQVE
jgi:hypothetical protein